MTKINKYIVFCIGLLLLVSGCGKKASNTEEGVQTPVLMSQETTESPENFEGTLTLLGGNIGETEQETNIQDTKKASDSSNTDATVPTVMVDDTRYESSIDDDSLASFEKDFQTFKGQVTAFEKKYPGEAETIAVCKTIISDIESVDISTLSKADVEDYHVLFEEYRRRFNG